MRCEHGKRPPAGKPATCGAMLNGVKNRAIRDGKPNGRKPARLVRNPRPDDSRHAAGVLTDVYADLMLAEYLTVRTRPRQQLRSAIKKVRKVLES